MLWNNAGRYLSSRRSLRASVDDASPVSTSVSTSEGDSSFVSTSEGDSSDASPNLSPCSNDFEPNGADFEPPETLTITRRCIGLGQDGPVSALNEQPTFHQVPDFEAALNISAVSACIHYLFFAANSLSILSLCNVHDSCRPSISITHPRQIKYFLLTYGDL